MASLEDHIGAIERFVEHGIEPGSCTRAILENNLRDAFARADEETREIMFYIVSYCYNEIPSNCWGSREKVDQWIRAIRAKMEERDDERRA